MKVSVIIPVYNGARFICQAIDSVLLQLESDPALTLQILVVNNNSTDNSVSLVTTTYGSTVELIEEPRQGLPSARNAGLLRATAPLIAFLDADDLWMPGKLKRQCTILDQQPELQMVFTQCVEFSDPTGVFPCRTTPLDTPICSSMLTRKEVFERAGLFPDFRSGEFIAWYGWTQSLGLSTKILPELLFKRRVHAHNTTRDRTAIADYPRAMAWLLARRRGLATGGP